MSDRKLTVGQLVIEFLSRQYTVDGDYRQRTIPGAFGIFGHGNVAGLGQALLQCAVADPRLMPYYQARNEQAMVHQSVAFARMKRRRSTFVSLASVGPGATNLLTGAALATTNRLPALLLPSDTFATRSCDPVLQQLELPQDATVSVNDAFKPLSRFFDRIVRPEQAFSALTSAMRVLLDPVETGAVTIAIPEDVQAEALVVPADFLCEREWRIHRPPANPEVIKQAARLIGEAGSPMVIAGGGVIYADASSELLEFVEQTGIGVGCTQAGMGAILGDHRLSLGGVGATGTLAANRLAAGADLVIGIGTRYSDFTTSSRSAFKNPEVIFININVASFDAHKHTRTLPVVADARLALIDLAKTLGPIKLADSYANTLATNKAQWTEVVKEALVDKGRDLPGQPEIIGVVNAASDPKDVVVCAAGSLPGDLHKLWRVQDELGYNVEYAYSCMGYEIAAGLGVARAAKGERDPLVMVGDGSYLMLSSEIVSAVAEGLKVIIILIQNQGYASIGHLSESVGSERYGTYYRYRDPQKNTFDKGVLPVNLAQSARGLGIDVIEINPRARALEDLAAAVKKAKAKTTSTLIHINSDPLIYAPEGEGWWEVPVAETSDLASTQAAYAQFLENKKAQRPLV